MNIDVGKVFGTCLDYIKENPLILAPQIAVGILSFILSMVLFEASLSFTPGSEINLGAVVGSLVLFGLIMAVASFIAFGVAACMAAEIVETGSTSLGTGFSRFMSNLGPILLVLILSGIIVGIGIVLCVLPGIAAAFFLMFSLAAVVYGDMGAIEAMQESFATVKDNLVDALVIAAIILGLSIGGGIIGGILGIIPVIGALISSIISGVIATFVLVLTIEAYKEITGEAPVAQPMA